MKNNKVILIVNDGWGVQTKKKNDAIFNAKTPFFDSLLQKYPNIQIKASGQEVGLPRGYAGNSEVGHITMGSGRQIDQSLLRINKAIKSQEFLTNPTIYKSILNVKKNNSTLHLVCLMQKAGVHAHLDHLYETLRYCKKEGLNHDNVLLHLITDGRDENPEESLEFLSEVKETMGELKVGNVATISGRYYAMDRNKKYNRTKLFYNAVVFGKSENIFECGIEAIFENHKDKITDEYIKPMIKKGYKGLQKNDSVFFINFRKDRARQFTNMVTGQKVEEIKYKKAPKHYFISTTRYDKEMKTDVVFENIIPQNTLGDILEENKKSQLRISETEKYAHVTFFFDGGVAKKHKNRKDILIPSPNVETYNLQPEMSSVKVTKEVVKNINTNKYDFIILNYPNADMVGHTGDFEATKKAVESIDQALKEVVKNGLKNNYTILITADHGNAEKVSEKFTAHTKSKVPFILINKKNEFSLNTKKTFGLSNIAQTILKILGIEENKNYNLSMLDK